MSALSRLPTTVTRRWATRLDDYVTSVSPAPDGRHLLATSLSGEATLLDTASGEATARLPLHPLGALSGAWSCDGRVVATAGQDNCIRLALAEGGRAVAEVGLDGWGAAVRWSPVDPLVAVAAGRSLTVLDAEGAIVHRWSDLESTATALEWSADGVSVGVACYGGVRWYRPGDPDRPTTHFAWKGSLLSLERSPDGKWVAAGGQDATVHVWRLWSGDDLAMTGYPAKIEHLAWDPSSRYLAVGGVGDVTIWDFAGRGPRGTRPATLTGPTRHIAALAYRPDGRALAALDGAGGQYLWATPKRARPVADHDLGESGACMAWSGDGSALYVGGAEGLVVGQDLAIDV
ncbi:MAG: hypothetical protein JNK12_10285 [Acidimicrobiales bacterium]|nr:hypothetical protein [Acidimicrobiales bacterium]